MLNHFLQDFKKLPLSNKSMVYLMWIYNFWLIISWIFINIYVFKIFDSIEYVILYNMIQFTWCVIWFFGIWLIMSIFEKNIKNMYYLWYWLFISSFVLLFLFNWEKNIIFLFWLLFWTWEWAFWNAVHGQELKNIEDKNRDFYSSSISAWTNIIKIICPLIIALLFTIANFTQINWYSALFLFLPFVYIISFLFIKNINDYTPKKISKKDFKNFFNFKKYKYWHSYFLLSWALDVLLAILIPILSIYFLKSEENVWIFTWVLTLIWTLLIIYLSKKRELDNRFKFFLVMTLLSVLNFLVLWFAFYSIIFVIFSLILIILTPIQEISWHVYNLTMMDSIKTSDNDFYPAMILREVVLWIWRIWILLITAWIILYFNLDKKEILQLMIFFVGIIELLFLLSTYLWEKNEKNYIE